MCSKGKSLQQLLTLKNFSAKLAPGTNFTLQNGARNQLYTISNFIVHKVEKKLESKVTQEQYSSCGRTTTTWNGSSRRVK